MIAEAFLNALTIPEHCKAVDVSDDNSALRIIRIYGRSSTWPVLYNLNESIEVIAFDTTLDVLHTCTPSGGDELLYQDRVTDSAKVFDLNDPESTPEAVSNVISNLVEQYFDKLPVSHNGSAPLL